MRRRALLWIGWPVLVLVAGGALPLFAWMWFDMRYAVFEMSWSRGDTVQLLAVVLLPPIFLEVVARVRRNNG
jgi:hypothetical protein